MTRDEIYSAVILEPGKGTFRHILLHDYERGYLYAHQPMRATMEPPAEKHLTLVPVSDIHPVAPPRLVRFTGDLDAADVYVKRPIWQRWQLGCDSIARLLLREAEVLLYVEETLAAAGISGTAAIASDPQRGTVATVRVPAGSADAVRRAFSGITTFHMNVEVG